MEDYSSNEKVKHEKQSKRKKYYDAFWSVCIYISICVIYVLRYLAIYILLLKFAISAICLEVISGNA